MSDPIISESGEISYEAVVELKREIVYCEPDVMGQKTTVIPMHEIETNGELDVEKLVDKLPAAAWGWLKQERFETSVNHAGKDYMLTSLPVSQSGTTFVGARYVDRDEIEAMVAAQEKYRQKCRRQNRPVGALPHGADKRTVLSALDHGETVIVTKDGNYRFFDQARDTLLEV